MGCGSSKQDAKVQEIEKKEEKKVEKKVEKKEEPKVEKKEEPKVEKKEEPKVEKKEEKPVVEKKEEPKVEKKEEPKVEKKEEKPVVEKKEEPKVEKKEEPKVEKKEELKVEKKEEPKVEKKEEKPVVVASDADVSPDNYFNKEMKDENFVKNEMKNILKGSRYYDLDQGDMLNLAKEARAAETEEKRDEFLANFRDHEGIQGLLRDFYNGKDYFGAVKSNQEEAYLITLITLLFLANPKSTHVEKLKRTVVEAYFKKFEKAPNTYDRKALDLGFHNLLAFFSKVMAICILYPVIRNNDMKSNWYNFDKNFAFVNAIMGKIVDDPDFSFSLAEEKIYSYSIAKLTHSNSLTSL